jgi:hypothetical protein
MKRWKQRTRSRLPQRLARQRGWGTSEYLAVLMGLMVVWRAAEGVLAMIQEHHDEFTWALMIPY